MKYLTTKAIVLQRINYGEADRILTLLTPEYGKLRLIAKGVRRVKSKLAGGIELFSVSDITFIQGRGEVGTLISARLNKHYGEIVKDVNRTMLGYKLVARLNKVTEDQPEGAYFDLLDQIFQSLNDPTIPSELIDFWFGAQLLSLGGHSPNLETDENNERLLTDHVYEFSFERMSFRTSANDHGQFEAKHIKFMRLAVLGRPIQLLARVQDNAVLTRSVAPLVDTMLATFLRV
jgi:DNA repair protein RecO (recombination protein O)